jgi:hypothetical protein
VNFRRLGRCAVRALLALSLGLQAAAGSASDVPYVPTPMNVVDAMLQLGGVGSGDFLVDLGSGDGRISIRAAARLGTRGFGVDIDDSLVLTAREEARRQGVHDKVAFEARDLFDADISPATVVTAYLLHGVNLRLRPMLFQQLRPGTRIVTHDFDFGDWPADRKLTIEVPDKAYGPPRSDIMLWVMPANAAGTWQWTSPGAAGVVRHELRVKQRFQMLQVTALVQGQAVPVRDARLRGNVIEFTLDTTAGVQQYRGEIAGDRLRGQAVHGADAGLPWQAVRSKAGKRDIGGGWLSGATAPAIKDY